MKRLNPLLISCLVVLSLTGCENHDLSEGEAFKPREIHEIKPFHFDKITVDGVEYLILEKDNNNPHEGFGFMAFRANLLLEKQDSLIAHVRTVQEQQNQILAAITKRPIDVVRAESDELYKTFLKEENQELEILEEEKLSSDSTSSE